MKDDPFNIPDGRFLKGISKFIDSNPTDDELDALVATIKNARKKFSASYRSLCNAAIHMIEEEQLARLEVKKVQDSY